MKCREVLGEGSTPIRQASVPVDRVRAHVPRKEWDDWAMIAEMYRSGYYLEAFDLMDVTYEIGGAWRRYPIVE